MKLRESSLSGSTNLIRSAQLAAARHNDPDQPAQRILPIGPPPQFVPARKIESSCSKVQSLD
jgi:hypothetical protein